MHDSEVSVHLQYDIKQGGINNAKDTKENEDSNKASRPHRYESNLGTNQVLLAIIGAERQTFYSEKDGSHFLRSVL